MTIINKELVEAAAPLMSYLARNHSPHTKAIVEPNSVELLAGIGYEETNEYLVD